jgi:hypothetical protein
VPSALQQYDASQQQQGGNGKPIAACPACRDKHRLDLVTGSKIVFGGLAAVSCCFLQSIQADTEMENRRFRIFQEASGNDASAGATRCRAL